MTAVLPTVLPLTIEQVNPPSELGGRVTPSAAIVDDDAAAGTVLGVLSVSGAGAGPWAFTLDDDAGGMFAISGHDLVVGLVALDHGNMPAPAITVTATNGKRTIRKTLVINVRRPLPSLPMAAGAKVVGVGHSFIQRGGWGILSGGKPRDLSVSNVRGVLPWIRLRDNRFNLDVWHDPTNNLGTDNYLTGAFQGVGGDHIVTEGGAPGVVARLPYVAALRPGIVYLDIATNDISSAPNVSVALVVGRLDTLLTLLRNEGIWTVIQTVADRGAWPQGDDRASIVAGVNEWIKAQATRDGVRVADCTELGFNYPTFDPTLFGGDVLHPNPKGGNAMAGVVLPILQEMVAPGDHMDLTDASIFGASNLWADAAGATTASSTATGTSGTRVSTLVIARSSGDSTVVAAVEDAGTYKKQVATWTMSGTETGNRYEEWRLRKNGSSITLASLGIVPGVDWLEAGCYVELSPWDGWLAVQLQLEFYDAGNAQKYIARGGLSNPDRSTQDLPLAASGFSGWLKVPAFLIPGDVGAINWTAASRPLVIEVNRRVAGPGGTLKFSKPFLRKCSDPRIAWNVAA
ncbi:MAG: hypothetical protein DI537_20510 [Stutzerimonas stutzeri]|nr:MAG: hypothetical protein DI537_20510 [Stutzerimonas stutzeri]